MPIHRVYSLLMRGFRARRMRRFVATFGVGEQTRILDVGGTAYNWELVDAQPRVTLLNPDPPDTPGPPARSGHTAVRGSGTHLAFPDGAFDVAFSNSVIEHVGSWDEQQAFAAELRRVARQVWVQTPARGFPFEPHLLAPFIHYLPRRWQRRLARNFTGWGWLTRPSQAVVDRVIGELRLLGHDHMQALFPDCEVRRERFLGLTKAFVAVRADAR